jgi:hypothetical protein
MIIFDVRFRLKKGDLFWNHKKRIWQETPSCRALVMEDAKREITSLKNDPEFDAINVVNVRTKTIEINDNAWEPREFLDGFDYEYIRSQFYNSDLQKWIRRARNLMKTLDESTQTVIIRGAKVPIEEIYLIKMGDNARYGWYNYDCHERFLKVIDKQFKKYVDITGTMMIHSTDDLMILKLRKPAYQKAMKRHGIDDFDFTVIVKLKDLFDAYNTMSNERKQRISKSQNLKHVDLTE